MLLVMGTKPGIKAKPPGDRQTVHGAGDLVRLWRFTGVANYVATIK